MNPPVEYEAIIEVRLTQHRYEMSVIGHLYMEDPPGSCFVRPGDPLLITNILTYEQRWPIQNVGSALLWAHYFHTKALRAREIHPDWTLPLLNIDPQLRDPNMATKVTPNGPLYCMVIRSAVAVGPLISLDFEYDAPLVEFFKLSIPSYERRWDGKMWHVSASWLSTFFRQITYRTRDVNMLTRHLNQAILASNNSEKIVRRHSLTLGTSKQYDKHTIGAFATETGSARKHGFFFPHKVLWEYFEGDRPEARRFLINSTDPFEVLDLETGATDSEIKEAYRAAVLRYHPDKGGATEDFIKIKAAYEKLTNSKYRAKLNLLKHTGVAATIPVAKKTPKEPPVLYRPPQNYGVITFNGRQAAAGVIATHIIDWSY